MGEQNNICSLNPKEDQNEKIKDNRVRTFEKRLRTFDREVEPKKLHLCMRIRQKAVYSPEGITRKEAEAAVHFLKKECEKLK